MYRGTPYTNRLVKEGEQKRLFAYHLDHLHRIKPLARNQYFEDFQLNNANKEYQNEQKCTEIERENLILLQKISSINNKTKRAKDSSPWANRGNKSLNSTYRTRKLQQIEIDNSKMLQRLQKNKPSYKTDKMNKDWKKHKYMIKLISHYPSNTGRGRRSSALEIHNKPDWAQATFQSCRVKVINGINFFISIKLTPIALKITGNTQQSKCTKIIDLSRAEAIEFIEKECQGKVQLLFDRLRYDKLKEDLYLVGNQIDIDDLIGPQAHKLNPELRNHSQSSEHLSCDHQESPGQSVGPQAHKLNPELNNHSQSSEHLSCDHKESPESQEQRQTLPNNNDCRPHEQKESQVGKPQTSQHSSADKAENEEIREDNSSELRNFESKQVQQNSQQAIDTVMAQKMNKQ